MNRQTGATSPKLILSLLGLMFLVPLTLAWLMYTGAINFSPGGGVNRGELVDPPIAADVPEQFLAQGLAEHWVLAHTLPGICADACQDRLHGLRQIHKALGRDAVRVRLLLLANSELMVSDLPEMEKPDSGFTVLDSNTGKLSQQFESLGDRHGIFIIDPLGNIMMRYASETNSNDILIDMERLLQYQKTDPQ